MEMTITQRTDGQHICRYRYSGKSGEINLTELLDPLISYELITRIPGMMARVGLNYAIWYLAQADTDLRAKEARTDLQDLSYLAEVFTNAVTT